MKFKKSLLAVAISLTSASVMAGGFKVSKDINVAGDMSAGIYYLKNHGGNGAEAIEVTDFGLAFDTGETKTGEVGFLGVIGTRNGRTIMDSHPDGSFAWGDNVVLDFGYATYAPVDNMTMDIGWILTTIGNEASPSIFSANINRGFLWNSQPAAYEGARVNYTAGGVNLSAELNHNNGGAGNPLDWAVSANGEAGSFSYAVTYYDGKDTVNIVDVVLNTSVSNIDVGLNVDYFMIDEAPTGTDDTAMGVGLYVTPKFGKIELPIRFEYVSDTDTGIYSVPGGGGVDNATTITVTPTYRVNDNMYVRAEFATVTAENEVFADEDGKATDSQMTAAFQIGSTF